MTKNLKIQLLIFALLHLFAAALAHADAQDTASGLPIRTYRDQCIRGGSMSEGFSSLALISRLAQETAQNDGEGFLLKNIAEDSDGKSCLYFFMAPKMLNAEQKKERQERLALAKLALKQTPRAPQGYLHYAFTPCEQDGYLKELLIRETKQELQPLIDAGLRHVDVVKLKGDNKCLHLFVRDYL